MMVERIVAIIIILLIAFGVYVLAVHGAGVFHSLIWQIDASIGEV